MVLLQNKLNLRVSQKQILTPGLVQMVSVLALNKLELKEMINTEMVENPVLEEFDPSVPLLDEVAGREEARERNDREEAQERLAVEAPTPAEEKKDPFDEIDFGSFFRDYLDPGYRSSADLEEIDRPSFENFLSRPTTLTDHLMWQLGALNVRPEVYAAAELIIGNLNEDGYLTASEDELLGVAQAQAEEVVEEAPASTDIADTNGARAAIEPKVAHTDPANLQLVVSHTPEPEVPAADHRNNGLAPVLQFSREHLKEAIALVRQFDPPGVASRDLRECLLAQLDHLQKTRYVDGSEDPENDQIIEDALKMVDGHLHFLINKQYKEMAKAIARPMEEVVRAHEFIRTLDPKPELRYNKVDAKLIEPDVAFVKHGDEYLILMNDEDLPQLRVSPTYRKLLNQGTEVEKDSGTYVQDPNNTTVQLIPNLEQRRQTILKA